MEIVMGVKQVIVIRKDLNMRKGKMAAQAAHASMLFLLNAMKREGTTVDTINHRVYQDLTLRIFHNSVLEKWLLSGSFKKICVSVDSEEELLDICKKAAAIDIPVALITDSGLTEFDGVPTKTCAAIGPEEDEKIDVVTGNLKLL